MSGPGVGDGVVLITGGAGFIGTNLAADFARQGRRVRLVDDLSRAGVERNLEWLRAGFGNNVELHRLDVTEPGAWIGTLDDVVAVYHLAAQVAVTTSLISPERDFRANLLGTFQLLEALRHLDEPPALVFASTNKVYGALSDLPLREDDSRFVSLGSQGIDESRPLDFHTPYGCSKGGAEQYVLDYARSFGLPATALRMSCIYGPHQCGTEDQGWVAHFLLRALEGEPIDIFGNGKQVRDILFVTDLVAAQRAALEHIDLLAGRAWNVGGGVSHSVSLRELLALATEAAGAAVEVRYQPPRAGDQKYYVSDCGAFAARTGWRPAVPPAVGVRRLYQWFADREPGSGLRRQSVAGGQ